jgi:hypothetical protein
MRILLALGAVFLMLPVIAPSSEPPSLSPGQFDKLRSLIKPKSGEDKWAEIPWLSSLWEARRQAATLGKPILLWEMDGNPLGCG